MSIASVFNPMPNDTLVNSDMPETARVGTEIVQIMEGSPYEQVGTYFGVDNVFAGTNADYQNHTMRNQKRLERDNYDVNHRDLMEKSVVDDYTANPDGMKKNQYRNNRVVNDMRKANPYSRARDNKDVSTAKNKRSKLTKTERRHARYARRHARYNEMYQRMPQGIKTFMYDVSHMYRGNTYAEKKAELDARFEHMFRLKEEMTGKSREEVKRYEEYKALNKIYQRHLQAIVCCWADEVCQTYNYNSNHSYRGDNVNRNNNCNRYDNCNKNDFNRIQDNRNFDYQFDNNNMDHYNSSRLNENDRTGIKKLSNSKQRGEIRLPDERYRDSIETREQDNNTVIR